MLAELSPKPRKEKQMAECEPKPTITYDDFTKLDMRVAKVLEISEHPNADKLLCMKIDLGGETRQIVAGIKEYYAPEAMVGRQIAVVTNLQPRKVRGIESNGMLLAAVNSEGGKIRDVVVLSPDREVPNGSPVS
ncbi:MAG: methionine--tRNA ligase subunit beta [Phycisphaerae bacterium]|nr:methionine--tRNA ligase subunit beta [Phycisphaerae bacterium]